MRIILKDIYFDKSIRDYALKLTKNKFDADDLVSKAFIICSQKQIQGNLKGYFAMVMRNQFLKQCNKKDIPHFQQDESFDTDAILDRMTPYYANILKAIKNGEKLTNLHKSAKISYTTLREDYTKAKREFKLLYSNPIFCICSQSSPKLYHTVHDIANTYKIPIVKPKFLKYEDVSHIFYTNKTSLFKQGVKMICEVKDWSEFKTDFKKDVHFNTIREHAKRLQTL